eukprot:2548338-Rhodomonas_salina.2
MMYPGTTTTSTTPIPGYAYTGKEPIRHVSGSHGGSCITQLSPYAPTPGAFLCRMPAVQRAFQPISRGTFSLTPPPSRPFTHPHRPRLAARCSSHGPGARPREQRPPRGRRACAR